MELKSIYLTNEGGITATSANHLANLAKEKIENYKIFLNSIALYDTTITLEGKEVVTDKGMTEDEFARIPKVIEEIQEAHGFIAWMREAIKAKETLFTEVNNVDFDKYCELKKIVLPEHKTYTALSEQDYWKKQTPEKLAAYLVLEAKCAVIGEVIHKGNSLSEARKKLYKTYSKPATLSSIKDIAYVEQYTPTIPQDKVEALFFELQNKHRELQAKLNGKKQSANSWVYSTNKDGNDKQLSEYETYVHQRTQHQEAFKKWKAEKLKEVEELKILVPAIFADFLKKIQQ